MAIKLQDLCRLCAAKDELSKDLMDESNETVLKLVRDLIKICISEEDDLPTKICLNCEEKMISFQLFILETFRVQEYLRNLQLEDDPNMLIKVEDEADINLPEIKSEVKDELSAEDIVDAINQNSDLSDCDNEIYEQKEEDDDYDEDLITIASLKEMKKKQPLIEEGNLTENAVSQDESTENGPSDLNTILMQKKFKVSDYVKMQCEICFKSQPVWRTLSIHYYKCHKMKPTLSCVCGFVIKSKTIMDKHISDHKNESRQLKRGLDKEDQKSSHPKVKDYVKFTCHKCVSTFSSWYKLKAHCAWKHKVHPVVQCICGIALKSKSVMYRHIQDHKNPDVIKCDKCPRVTTTMAAMNKHKMKHMPKETKFSCTRCNKTFRSKEGWKSHERTHVPIEERKVYRCEICDMKFTTRSSAASHKRVVHDKIKAYVCDLCGYACGTNGELRQHRAIHSDAKPFACKTCNKSFKTYSNLKTHMDTHEDTAYACHLCNRILNSRRTLRKHLLVHEDKCGHVCSYCNKAFKRRQTLKVHLHTHTGDKPLSCKWCEERFAYASSLRSHRLRCHPDKMSGPQTHDAYIYHHTSNTMPEDYVKNDVAAIGVGLAKDEEEAM